MLGDLNAIAHPEVKMFYGLYMAQRRVIRDFFVNLPDDKFDFRMVDTPQRRSDSPRENLVHILDVQLVYMDAIKTGKLDWSKIGRIDASGSKAQLLAEMDRIDAEFYDYITNPDFDPDKPVDAPWGTMNAGSMLHATREHDILHVGINLAIMDHLNMPRFESLKAYWGE